MPNTKREKVYYFYSASTYDKQGYEHKISWMIIENSHRDKSDVFMECWNDLTKKTWGSTVFFHQFYIVK